MGGEVVWSGRNGTRPLECTGRRSLAKKEKAHSTVPRGAGDFGMLRENQEEVE